MNGLLRAAEMRIDALEAAGEILADLLCDERMGSPTWLAEVKEAVRQWEELGGPEIEFRG